MTRNDMCNTDHGPGMTSAELYFQYDSKARFHVTVRIQGPVVQN